MNNYDTKNYLSFSHPHQETIRKTFEKFIGNKIKKINMALMVVVLLSIVLKLKI